MNSHIERIATLSESIWLADSWSEEVLPETEVCDRCNQHPEEAKNYHIACTNIPYSELRQWREQMRNVRNSPGEG
jgi:hypothetical protein